MAEIAFGFSISRWRELNLDELTGGAILITFIRSYVKFFPFEKSIEHDF